MTPQHNPAPQGVEPDEWLKSGEYLPAFMRDFHDQKDLFLALQDVADRSNAKHGGQRGMSLTWTDAHIYTVDVFLWCLARRGWTLQRSRKALSFADIHEFVGEAKRSRDQQSAAILREALAKATS